MSLLGKTSKSHLLWLLLIVVVGLLSCAQTRYRLNEVSAQASLRAIRNAETIYRSQDPQNRFGTLPELHSSGLIEADLASGTKDGYRIDVQVSKESFSAIATPLEYDVTGSWSFYVDESGIIRGTTRKGRLPGGTDAPVRNQ